MNKKNWASAIVLLALMLGLSTPGLAISLDFIGVAGGPSPVGPYKFIITGDVAIGGSTPLGALPDGEILGICNDISGGVPGFGPGDAWEVQKHNLADVPLLDVLDSGSLQYGKVGTGSETSTRAKFWHDSSTNFLYAEARDYQAGAWLANRVLVNIERTDSQYALWGLFKTNEVLTANQIALKTAAYAAVDSGNWDGWKSFAVYTMVPLGEAPPGGTQEIYVRVPEAASFASLGLYFGGLGLLGYAFRRRMK